MIDFISPNINTDIFIKRIMNKILEQVEQTELLKSSATDLLVNDDGYRKLRSELHPDRFPFNTPLQARAEKAFIKLEKLYELMKEPDIEISSKNNNYVLGDLLGVGDVSNVYRASSNGKHDFIAKVSRIKGGDLFISRESQVLTKLTKAVGDLTYKNYFPRLVESFLWKEDFQRRVNIFEEPHKLYNLDQVKLRYPDGVDGRHVCWIFRRILTGLGFFHRQNVVHGAILPQHILVEPDSHGVCICGWIHSIEPNQLITVVPQSYKTWYPEEVLKKTYSGPESDIFLAAKTVLYIADEELPKPIRRFLESLLLDSPKMRPSDAWKLNDEFTEVMDSVYGIRRFVPFLMK